MEDQKPKILKNPHQRVIEVMWGGQITIFQPGESKAVNGDAANHFLTEVNAGLIDVTESLSDSKDTTPVKIVDPGASGEAVSFDYTSKTLPQLLKLAKQRGLKSKFGMSKLEVIDLLING